MKILVIHATAGAGHKKAAEGIYNALKTTNHQAHLVDALDYTNPVFKWMYPEVYTFMVTKIPILWKFFFWLLDIPLLQPLVRIVRRIYNGINAHGLERFIVQEKFDCIITTQFLSAEVCSYLKRTGKISSKIICVVTDFDVHHIWVNQGIDRYAVACDYTKDKIVSLGVNPSQVFVTGIPTDEKFSVFIDRRQIREQLKLNPNMFTVLLATGSFGMGPLEELIEVLKGHQLVVVCGHNKALYNKLSKQKSKDVHILGLVNNMHELMSAADIMVTKPGGLSIAEALVKKLPLIFFSAIPGQEMGNIRVLKKYGAAADQGILSDIIKKVDDLSANPEMYQDLRSKLEPLSKPHAVRDIIQLI
jgi:processive 1,2-diacylglycerol beta-glucosyltransferase